MGNIISWSYLKDTISYQDFSKYQQEMNQKIERMQADLDNIEQKTSLMTALKNEVNDFYNSINAQTKNVEHNTKSLNQKIKWLEEHFEKLDRNINDIGVEDRSQLQYKINQLNTIINKLNTNVSDYLEIKNSIRQIETKIKCIEYQNNKSDCDTGTEADIDTDTDNEESTQEIIAESKETTNENNLKLKTELHPITKALTNGSSTLYKSIL